MSTDFGFKASDTEDYYFVSYNTEDSQRVAEICRLLNERNLHIWYDEGIPHDSLWEGVIAEKIGHCKEAILFITKGIFEKAKEKAGNEIFTLREYNIARNRKKRILIVLLDDINAMDDVPYSLDFWWQDINPNKRQGVIAISDPPNVVANKILHALDREDISDPIYQPDEGEQNPQEQEPTNTSENSTDGDDSAGCSDNAKKRNHKKLPILIGCCVLLIIAGIIVCHHFISEKNEIKNLQGWGPERPLYTMGIPAPLPTFNSITDNPTIGDERDFVRMCEVGGTYSNEVKVEKGKQYSVFIYIDNNASEKNNNEESDFSSVAKDVKVCSQFSQTVSPQIGGAVSGKIKSSNSNPVTIWDGVKLTSDEKVTLHYHAASAIIHNNYEADGSVLSTNLFSDEGTIVGLNELNGVLLGGDDYHCVVTYLLDAK